MRRNAALFLLGAWLAGSVFMAMAATESFRAVDRALGEAPHSGLGGVIEEVGRERLRDSLRYTASEVNRRLFQVWGWAQIALGAAVTALVWRGGARRIRWSAAVMLALALILVIGLTPPILSIGRELDFVAREPPPPGMAAFGLLHAAYTIIDGVKAAIGLLAAFWLIRMSS